ncbi:hypothetical protein EDD86DRAFT_244750 [Gorgonomyces haynaldii]|nr:hypothetical protein EDD86DRAFT_244750 [Gorgonomyces haynaldii]
MSLAFLEVDLAVETFDTVDRHIQRLDDDLARFEEEQLTGPKVQQEKYFQTLPTNVLMFKIGKRLDEQEAQQRQQRQPQKKVIKPQVTRKEVKKDAMPVEFERVTMTTV